MAAKQKNRLTWSIVLISLAGVLIYAVSGAIRTNYGIMRGAISEVTGVGYADMSLILAFSQLMYGLFQPIFGMLAIKRSNAFVLCLGAVLIIIGLIVIPMCGGMLMLMAFLGFIMPIGTAALCYGMVMGTISQALPKSYAAAVSGVLSAANGIASSVMAPVIQRLIASRGIASTMLIPCIPTALVIPLAIWLAKKSAENAVEDATIDERPSMRTLLGEGFRNREYMHVALAFFTCGFHMTIIETHLYTQVVGYGIPEDTAAYGMTLYGMFAIAGALVIGALCSKLKNKYVLGSLYASRPVMIILFLLMPKTVFSVFAFFAALGFTGNSTVPPTSGILRQNFSPIKFATLYGICMVFHQVGGFLSSWLGGLLVESTGSYNAIWLMGAALAACASVLAFTVHEEYPAAAA